MKTIDYDELGQILAKLFLPEPGAAALVALEERNTKSVVFNKYIDYYNAGRLAAIKDIKQLIKQSQLMEGVKNE